ncbi:ABC transporter permease [Hoeflea prorocentri]|uniref:ABC transporter permease n=1 Tax=Hoeflea prorocentri TaxID=1922333 RepID=A0A9X3UE56_9HYPH|nr:ABC transporter permease [Hoeflea prorocentri]MCY6379652.1 ABC transporter permease [Hoeflea prorocentri]MDA5397452.1 ABC transporter permease [Hoeflea prorocentri]
MTQILHHLRGQFSHLIVPAGLVAVLLLICAFRSPQLFSAVGAAGAILVSAPLILAAMAITPIAMAGRGGVDLSIGPAIGFINVTIVTWLTSWGFESPVAVFVFAIVVGCIWQILLASMIVFVRVSPIIVSLAGFMILSGVNLVILPRPGGLAPDWLSDWGYGTELFSPVLFVLIAAFVLWFLFQRTAMFQHIRLMGADEKTAYTVGININVVRFAAHLSAGVLTGLAAVCLTGLIGSGDPSQGNTLTLQAITALVLGGTSLAGGRGGVVGSILGAIAMYLIFVVLSSFDFGAISGFMTQMSYGLILVLSLLLTLVATRPKPAAV